MIGWLIYAVAWTIAITLCVKGYRAYKRDDFGRASALMAVASAVWFIAVVANLAIK